MFLDIAILTFKESLSNLIKSFLTPNWTTFFAHLFSSIIIIVIVAYWFWKPTQEFIAKHKERISHTHKELTVANNETQRYLKILKDESDRLSTVRKKAIEEVKKEAEDILLNAKTQAKEESATIVENAVKKAKALEEEAQVFVRNSVINLSIDLTKKLVGENINRENSEKIINDYISELESRSVTDGFK